MITSARTRRVEGSLSVVLSPVWARAGFGLGIAGFDEAVGSEEINVAVEAVSRISHRGASKKPLLLFHTTVNAKQAAFAMTECNQSAFEFAAVSVLSSI